MLSIKKSFKMMLLNIAETPCPNSGWPRSTGARKPMSGAVIVDVAVT